MIHSPSHNPQSPSTCDVVGTFTLKGAKTTNTARFTGRTARLAWNGPRREKD